MDDPSVIVSIRITAYKKRPPKGSFFDWRNLLIVYYVKKIAIRQDSSPKQERKTGKIAAFLGNSSSVRKWEVTTQI